MEGKGKSQTFLCAERSIGVSASGLAFISILLLSCFFPTISLLWDQFKAERLETSPIENSTMNPSRFTGLRTASRFSSISKPSQLLKSSNISRTYSTSSTSTPSKSGNFAILALLSTLAGGAGYLYAISSRQDLPSKPFLPISSSSIDSRYSYTRDLSPQNLPHQYGSEKDFNRAIAEIKGYFSATSSGDPGDQYDDYVTDEDQTELERHGYDEIGHDADTKKPHCVVFARSVEDVVKIVQVSEKNRS